MTIATDHQVTPDGALLIRALLKASAVASFVFALAWLRWPLSAQMLTSTGFIFIKYGILITEFSTCIGIPIIHLMARFRATQWWVYLLAAAVAGSLLMGILSWRPSNGMNSPLARAFSIWTQYGPDFADPPFAFDYGGRILFGAVVAGVVGISFWYFYTSKVRQSKISG